MSGAASPSNDDFAVAERVARAVGLEHAPTRVSLIGEGVKAHVLRLEFDAVQPLALKLYKRTDAAGRELAAYAELGDRVPAAPRVIAADKSAEFAPHGYLLMTLARGLPMNRELAGMAREDLLGLYEEIGALLARFHELAQPCFAVVPGERDGVAGNRQWFAAETARAVAAFRARGGRERLAVAIEEWFAGNSAGIDECAQACFCHGDLHPANLLVERLEGRPRLAGVLDFETACAGDPAMDIVHTIQQSPAPLEQARAALLAGYGDPPPWLDEVFDAYWLYCEIELWNFFAEGGSRGATRSIARRIARQVGLRRPWRMAGAMRLTSRPS